MQNNDKINPREIFNSVLSKETSGLANHETTRDVVCDVESTDSIFSA